MQKYIFEESNLLDVQYNNYIKFIQEGIEGEINKCSSIHCSLKNLIQNFKISFDSLSEELIEKELNTWNKKNINKKKRLIDKIFYIYLNTVIEYQFGLVNTNFKILNFKNIKKVTNEIVDEENILDEDFKENFSEEYDTEYGINDPNFYFLEENLNLKKLSKNLSENEFFKSFLILFNINLPNNGILNLKKKNKKNILYNLIKLQNKDKNKKYKYKGIKIKSSILRDYSLEKNFNLNKDLLYTSYYNTFGIYSTILNSRCNNNKIVCGGWKENKRIYKDLNNYLNNENKIYSATSINLKENNKDINFIKEIQNNKFNFKSIPKIFYSPFSKEELLKTKNLYYFKNKRKLKKLPKRKNKSICSTKNISKKNIYSFPLFSPICNPTDTRLIYTNLNLFQDKKKDLFGSIPRMEEGGYFYINNSSKIFINQFKRKEGIYFNYDVLDIVPKDFNQRWFRFNYDKNKDEIFCCMNVIDFSRSFPVKVKRKINASILFKCIKVLENIFLKILNNFNNYNELIEVLFLSCKVSTNYNSINNLKINDRIILCLILIPEFYKEVKLYSTLFYESYRFLNIKNLEYIPSILELNSYKLFNRFKRKECIMGSKGNILNYETKILFKGIEYIYINFLSESSFFIENNKNLKNNFQQYNASTVYNFLKTKISSKMLSTLFINLKDYTFNPKKETNKESFDNLKAKGINEFFCEKLKDEYEILIENINSDFSKNCVDIKSQLQDISFPKNLSNYFLIEEEDKTILNIKEKKDSMYNAIIHNCIYNFGESNKILNVSELFLEKNLKYKFAFLNKNKNNKWYNIKNHNINNYNKTKNYISTITKYINYNINLNSLVSNNLLKKLKSIDLFQYMDETNLLSELSTKRKITRLGSGGLSRDSITMSVRGIDISSYGRICPVETPEGKSAGIVNSFSLLCNIINGNFCIPYYSIYGKLEEKDNGVRYLDSKMEKYNYKSIYLKDKNKIVIGEGFVEDNKKDIKDLSLTRGLNYNGLFGIGASLIPFLEHNDAIRCLMGSNMQRQSVPVLNAESPLVRTCYEEKIVYESGRMDFSNSSGFVLDSSDTTLVLLEKVQNLNKNMRSLDLFSHYISENFCTQDISHKRVASFKKVKQYFNNNDIKGKETFLLKHVTNQKTVHYNRKLHNIGDWVLKGDLLYDTSGSSKGILSLGKNVLVGYLPWRGYNFEDAIVISERLVNEDVFTSLSIREYSSKLNKAIKVEELEGDLDFEEDEDNLELKIQRKLNIVNKLKYKKILLKEGLNKIKIERQFSKKNKKIKNKKNKSILKSLNFNSILYNGNLFNSHIRNSRYKTLWNIIYNEEKEKYNCASNKIEDFDNFMKPNNYEGEEFYTNCINYFDETRFKEELDHLDINGLPKINSFLKAGSILIGKVEIIKKEQMHNYIEYDEYVFKDRSILMKRDGIIKEIKIESYKYSNYLGFKTIDKVRIFVEEKNRIEVGDKMSGRHGNKGVVSIIVPVNEMPYLPDGTPLDILLNPLGVPSRMNLGQVLEGLLGLACKNLNESITLKSFDEIYGENTSRNLVYSKLYEARLYTGKNWLFDEKNPGKIQLFDGLTGRALDQPTTVGISYMLKLNHMVRKKIHARSTGPYASITEQPLGGKSNNGGQRIGEMEVWALEGYGAANALHEIVTLKSDDIEARSKVEDYMSGIIEELKTTSPEVFVLITQEIRSLCLNLEILNA